MGGSGNTPDFLGQHHKVIAVLGEGSFGVVTKCRNLRSNKTVAVKVLKKDTLNATNREIANLRRFQRLDPDRCHLIRFNGFFFHQGRACLSFELLDVDLRTYVSEVHRASKRSGLALLRVRSLTRQLVTALDFLEIAGLVHGDIKPENIMVVDRSRRPVQVKLVDFGGAQPSDRADPETLVHTRRYGSPELLLVAPLSEATDVWSVGVTAAELALGARLFQHKDRYSLLRSITRLAGQPPDSVLDLGGRTPDLFNRRPHGVPRWTLKTPEEYERETDAEVPEDRAPFRRFGDIGERLEAERGPQKGQDLFVDLITNMLHVDPARRLTPLEALQHPFLARSTPP